MGIGKSSLERLQADIAAGQLSRRTVLKRAMALSLSAPIISGLLAACGDDDDEEPADETEPTTETGAGEPTEAEPTEAAEEEPTEATGEATEETGEATEEPAAEATTAPAPAGERGGGGEARLLYWQAPTILNPHLSTGTKDDHASRVCIEPLFDFNNDAEPILQLAAEWPSVENELLDPDGMWVIWKLKEGVKWHDGEDFTAEDVVFTHEYVTNEDTTATTVGAHLTIDSMEIVDDLTVRVNFKEPNPAWFDAFSVGVVPEHALRDFVGAAARDAPFNLKPVGTGPFMVREFRPGDVVFYDLFPDYWDPGKPFFDSIQIKGGGDAASAARAVVQTGDYDWAWNLQVEPKILASLTDGDTFGEILGLPGTSAERIMINFADPNVEVDGAFSEPSTEHPIFTDLKVRQALDKAIQRDIITTQLYGEGSEPTAYNLNVPFTLKPEDLTWEYNIEAAQALIDEAGVEPGYKLLYQTSINSVRQKTQEIVKEDLETLGFSVELKSVDSGVFFSSDAGNPDNYPHFYADLEMYTNGPGSPYPITWAERYRSDNLAQKSNNWAEENITRYFNPEYDKLHDEAQTTIDEARQVELWQEMMTMVYNDVVEIPIVWRGGVAAKHNRIANNTPSLWASTPVYDLKNWTLNE